MYIQLVHITLYSSTVEPLSYSHPVNTRATSLTYSHFFLAQTKAYMYMLSGIYLFSIKNSFNMRTPLINNTARFLKPVGDWISEVALYMHMHEVNCIKSTAL